MSVQQRNRKRRIMMTVLFLVMLFGTCTQASAAWKMNADGTYSYYKGGKLLKNQWIGKNYYVDARGVRRTGWMKQNGKWYFFSKSGMLLKKLWIRSGGKMYYAGADGALYTGGRFAVGDYYYAFSNRGVRLSGKRTYGGKSYYFLPTNGRMVKKQWVKSKGKSYYYGANGVLAKNKWVGKYYVGSNGARLVNTWKGKRYLGASGAALTGLQKIDGKYYYFNTSTYEKVTDTTITEDGVTYQFDGDGVGKVSGTQKVPKTDVSVEPTYYTDAYVSDEKLLAAIIYCEAGNQSYTGKLAVGLVIANRTLSDKFPSKFREIVYQKSQFTPARNGSLTRALNQYSIVTAECRKAAAEIMDNYADYKKGKKVTLKISGKNVSFPCLFFMTKAAYNGLGLRAKYRQIGAHVFFTTWG